jgi:hypothetical protein
MTDEQPPDRESMEPPAPAVPTGGATQPGAAPGAAGPPVRRRSTAWGCVVTILQVLLALSVVVGILGAIAVYQLNQSYRAPHATPAGVTWATEEVVLPGGASLVVGRVTFEVTGLPTNGVRLGLSAAVPSFSGAAATPGGSTSGDAGFAIDGPLVRLTSTQSGSPRTCMAPCELEIPADFECHDGACRMVLEVSLELVDTGAAGDRAVSLSIGGGVAPGPGAPPPQAVSVDLSFNPATQAGGE